MPLLFLSIVDGKLQTESKSGRLVLTNITKHHRRPPIKIEYKRYPINLKIESQMWA